MVNGKVVVVIPTHGGAEFIERSIQSVLNQTYENVEVAVVDDNGRGSDNQKLTEERMSAFLGNNKVKYYIHEQNKNGSAARNTGAFNSDSEFITFLDDDDEYYPDKIANQVEYLNQNENIAMCWSGGEIYINGICEYTRTPTQGEKANLVDVLLHKTVLGSNAMMIRRIAYEELNGFDETFRRHQDWEFSARAVAKYNVSSDGGNGFKHYIIGRNNPKNPEQAIFYRKHYLDKMQNVMFSLTDKEKKIIYAENMVDALLTYLKAHRFIDFIKVFHKEKLGLLGYKILCRRIWNEFRKRMK